MLLPPVLLSSLPHLDRPIFSARGKTCAIRRPRHRMHRSDVPFVGVEAPPPLRIPLLDVLIDSTSSRSQASPIRRPGYCPYCKRMVPIGGQYSACLGLPNLYCAIIAGRSKESTIRRPGNPTHPVFMAAIGQQAYPRLSLPDLHSQ